jgi:hypothetical protein
MKGAFMAVRRNADLDWLFLECEAEFGIKSNFSSLILASKVGFKRARLDDAGDLVNGAQEDFYNEDALIDAIDARRGRARLGAAAKNRRIMSAYRRLDVQQQRVLEAAYEARQLPPQVRQALGRAAGVARLTSTWPTGWSYTLFARALGREDTRAAAICREAEQLLAAAVAAYEHAAGAARAAA